MKRTLFLMLIGIVACTTSGISQSEFPVGMFEVEFFAGTSFATVYKGLSTLSGTKAGLECRFNIPETTFDIGLQTSASSFRRKGTDRNNHVSVFSYSLFSDYNLRQWRNASLFFGLGAGYADITDEVEKNVQNGYPRIESTLESNAFCVTPRIGIEFDRLRLGLEYMITKRNASCLGFNLGFVFGGKYKKQKFDIY